MNNLLFEAITKAQNALAEWIVPDSKMTDKEVLIELVGILDDKELVRTIHSFNAPFPKNHRIRSKEEIEIDENTKSPFPEECKSYQPSPKVEDALLTTVKNALKSIGMEEVNHQDITNAIKNYFAEPKGTDEITELRKEIELQKDAKRYYSESWMLCKAKLEALQQSKKGWSDAEVFEVFTAFLEKNPQDNLWKNIFTSWLAQYKAEKGIL